MSDSPRTDAMANNYGYAYEDVVKFCQKLERELIATQSELTAANARITEHVSDLELLSIEKGQLKEQVAALTIRAEAAERKEQIAQGGWTQAAFHRDTLRCESADWKRLFKEQCQRVAALEAEKAARIPVAAVIAMQERQKEAISQAVAVTVERCAKVCEGDGIEGESPDCWGWHQKDYARAIRALSPADIAKELAR